MKRGLRLSHRAVPAKSKRRPDLPDPKGNPLGLFVRSTMEANTIRVFEFLKARGIIFSWAYEPRVFLFAEFGYRRGPWAYTPDVLVHWYADALRDAARRGWADTLPGTRPSNFGDGRLTAVEEWFEIKGREVSSDRSKRKRMAKHYPDVALTVVDSSGYRDLRKLYKPLLGGLWE